MADAPVPVCQSYGPFCALRSGDEVARAARLLLFGFEFYFAVTAIEGQGAAETTLVLEIESDTRIKRQGIEVQADGAALSVVSVLDLMDGVLLVHECDA